MNLPHNRYRLALLLLCSALIVGTTGMSRHAPRFQDGARVVSTQLIVSISSDVESDNGVVVLARLLTSAGEPVTQSDLILYTRVSTPIVVATDAEGVSRFHLPDDLPAGDYALRVGFPGKPG